VRIAPLLESYLAKTFYEATHPPINKKSFWKCHTPHPPSKIIKLPEGFSRYAVKPLTPLSKRDFSLTKRRYNSNFL
jgi:hypothetical protein